MQRKTRIDLMILIAEHLTLEKVFAFNKFIWYSKSYVNDTVPLNVMVISVLKLDRHLTQKRNYYLRMIDVVNKRSRAQCLESVLLQENVVPFN
jgi:hypothetical protein